MSADPDVFGVALTLPVAERAELAHRLLASLDEPEDDPALVEADWAAEIGRRVDDIGAGVIAGISWDEVREQFGR
jgi:putative addiction module component (TIGR02574 family)